MIHVVVDPDSTAVGELCAVIRSQRRDRQRYPEACVTPVADAETALRMAAGNSKLQPAVVYGPSVSSESQRVYFLVRWLD